MINAINIGIKKIKIDGIGAFVSALCMIHCLATPVFFIASACSASCCNLAPTWWQTLDYVFLFISVFAIFQSSKTSNNTRIITGLWISWLCLCFFIFNAWNGSAKHLHVGSDAVEALAVASV